MRGYFLVCSRRRKFSVQLQTGPRTLPVTRVQPDAGGRAQRPEKTGSATSVGLAKPTISQLLTKAPRRVTITVGPRDTLPIVVFERWRVTGEPAQYLKLVLRGQGRYLSHWRFDADRHGSVVLTRRRNASGETMVLSHPVQGLA